jgi:hypothetical protein
MFVRWSALVIAASALVACGSSSPKSDASAPTSSGASAPSSAPPAGPTGSATPTDTAAAPTTPPPGGPAPISLPGRWTSPRCGERKYVRNLELLDGGTFKAEDRVSPCPPNVQCVWSGIIHRTGSWAQEGNTVKLVVDKDRNPPRGQVLPQSLEHAGAELVEVQGSERCSYTKL